MIKICVLLSKQMGTMRSVLVRTAVICGRVKHGDHNLSALVWHMVIKTNTLCDLCEERNGEREFVFAWMCVFVSILWLSCHDVLMVVGAK